jgi:hypothetical protein
MLATVFFTAGKRKLFLQQVSVGEQAGIIASGMNSARSRGDALGGVNLNRSASPAR